MLVKFINKLVS